MNGRGGGGHIFIEVEMEEPVAVLLLSQSSIAVFMLTALLNLLTVCLPSSHGLDILVFLHKLTPVLSKPL